ncbi:ribbon-helix-helix protein, CopG family [Propionicimonas sp.]|uniref:ribbon-helix-helix protein, CopG family n=1 Tax=Propionicimonas sp. TaxID=1955623 RepID=UPI003A522E46
MSRLERRLQILLDDERYRLLESEAERTNESIGEIVRQAIDLRFADEWTIRISAAERLLALPVTPDGPEPSWASVKAEPEAELERQA